MGANILKNLFSSGQWQLGDTDTTTDIGKVELEEGRKTSERMKDNEGNATGEEESTNERRKQFSNKRKSKGVVVKPQAVRDH